MPAAHKKRGPMVGRLFIFSAYTPLGFSALGVGADPCVPSFINFFTFSTFLILHPPKVLSRNDGLVFIRKKN
jgi:hypothetical protein